MRWLPHMIAILALGAIVASSDESRISWQVRRARTCDAEKAGGYPEWTVEFTGSDEKCSVAIAGDKGPARGIIYIGRHVRVPEKEALSLDLSYTTFCGLDHRSGTLFVAVFTPDAWDTLGTEPTTALIDGQDERARALWRSTVHPMTGPDVAEPKRLGEVTRAAMSGFLRAQAGERVVLAVGWQGAHRSPEHASFHDLHITRTKPEAPMKALFDRIDLTREDLADVRAAVERGDYAEAIDGLVAHFRDRLAMPRPEKLSRRTWEEANQALEDRFRSIGSPEFFELGEDFNWSRNAIDDKEWLIHFQWHHILRTLVEAGAIGGDDRYTQKAVDLIRDWIPKNYPGSPWSWRTLEVALRAMNWTTIYRYLVHYEGFTREDHAAFLNTLAQHLDYLLPEERFHSGHNFGATESKALLTVGFAMPEFKNAELWRETAWERFEGEIKKQVLADGAQKELTTGYHVGVTNTFFSMAQLAKEHGLEPSPLYWERLEKMHEYSALLTKPDGTQPNLGDSWGGNAQSSVRRGGEFFDRQDMTFIATNGERGKRPDYLDTSLPETGYYVMRTSWTDNPQGTYVLLDAAHHWGGWHQHYDALAVNLYAYGRTLTPDAGPFSYDHPDRKLFQGTPYHSTVSVDGGNQNTSPCTLHGFFSTDGLSFADASQQGYEGIVHRRQVLFVRPVAEAIPYVVVIDRVTGQGSHTLDQHWHLPPGDIEVSRKEMAARTTFSEGGNLLIQALVREGVRLRPGVSGITAGYRKRQERPDVCFTREGELPALFATLLLPFEGPEPPEFDARVLEAAPDGVVKIELSIGDIRDIVLAAPEPIATTVAGQRSSGQARLVRFGAGTPVLRDETAAAGDENAGPQ